MSTRIVDYKILSFWHSPLALEIEVKNLLKEGWVLHLPIQVSMNTIVNPENNKEFKSTLLYTQTMVKYEEVES